ncbi:MAG: VCBS repeat-containing protein, partial [Verrucomicrobia bacterium]|nr:VCBS repeat-containing protein [Verrucomicrobiota bacterium]
MAGHAFDWQPELGAKSAQLAVSLSGKPGFIQLKPAATGLTFTNRLAQSRYLTNQIHLNGSGVAAGDVDNDGWCDLYFCGLDGPNVLYRNRGSWRFEDVTASAGVTCTDLDATGAVFADLDGDGDLDLVVNSVGAGTHRFLNNGKGRFTPLSSNSPLNPGKGGTTSALADIDGDGDLDLYVANYRTTTIRDMPNTRMRVNEVNGKLVVLRVNDRPVTEPDLIGRFTLDYSRKIVEHGEVDVLYRNEGNGTFIPIPFTGGSFLDEAGQPLLTPPYDWGLTVAFRDINGDGLPDIYVCNDFSAPDRIWLNIGNGRFQAIPRLALRTTPQFSMGVDFADLNRDGHDEIFVADMLSRSHEKRHVQIGDIMPVFLKIGEIEDRPQYSRNTLFFNRGDGTYAEIGRFSGVEASEWSWSPVFLDVDLDGFEDLLITTGHELEMMHADIAKRAESMKAGKKLSFQEQLALRLMFPRLNSPNAAFRNRGDLTFEDVSVAWGFDTRGVSQAMVLADLDNDGDLDVVMNNLNEVAGVYRNDGPAPRVAVRLKGLPPNTQGIGAKIHVLGGPVPQSQEVICGGRYLSG